MFISQNFFLGNPNENQADERLRELEIAIKDIDMKIQQKKNDQINQLNPIMQVHKTIFRDIKLYFSET